MSVPAPAVTLSMAARPEGVGVVRQALAGMADAFELRGAAGQGTEVRMTFAYVRDLDPADTNPVTGTIGSDGRWDTEAGDQPRS